MYGVSVSSGLGFGRDLKPRWRRDLFR